MSVFRPSVLMAGMLCAVAPQASLLGAFPLQTELAAQARQQQVVSEGRLLRSAASLESRGDFSGAEEILSGLLRDNPVSTGALFALERVLRAQGRVQAVLPTVDRFISEDPAHPGPRTMKLRVLTEVDSLDALRIAGEDWLAAQPEVPDPYREVARSFEATLGRGSALEVLVLGREALSQPKAFGIEMGDLLLGEGEPERIGDDGAQVSAVLRRVTRLDGDRRALTKPLVDALGADPTTVSRRRAGARIALEVGLEEEARSLASRAVEDLEGQTRRGFLLTVARRAEEQEAHGVALWAYERLREQASDATDGRSLDEHIAEVALSVGDTAKSLDAQLRVAESLPKGTPQRRRAMAGVMRLHIARGSDNSGALLATFRTEYPRAPELDELTVALAAALQREGRSGEAEVLLGAVDGPRSALERGYLALLEGRFEDGREALLAAARGLPAVQATEVIAMVSALSRVGPEAKVLLSSAAVAAHRGDAPLALADLDAGIEGLGRADQPYLLARAGDMAHAAQDEAAAARFRERLVREFPEAPEAPEATLALARYKAGRPGEQREAIDLLEALILGHPNSAVVPTARRELRRMRGGALQKEETP